MIGATTSGSEYATLITPRSFARSDAAGSTAVSAAGAAAQYVPKPAPSSGAAASAAGQVGEMTRMTAAVPQVMAAATMNGFLRPDRCEAGPHTPPAMASATGLASSDAIALAAMTTENRTALSAGCSDWTCSGSRTWIGA